MHWNIYRKILLFAIVIIILPVFILGFLSYRETEMMVANQIKQTSHLAMENAANHFIKYYIGEIEAVLNILTSDPALLEISDKQNQQHLLETWEQYRRKSENIWHISYGTAEGEFFIAPQWEPPTGYDPRVSPWFQAAINVPGIVWSEPYVEPVRTNTVVAGTKMIYKDGKFHGVFGIHTSLNKLSEIISSIKIGPGGYLILLDAKANIIAHNELALLGTNVRDMNWYNQLVRSERQSIMMDVQGRKTYISAVDIPQTGWLLVGFIPEEIFVSEAAPIKTTTIIIAFLGIFFASLISAVVSKGFVSRIQGMVQNMSRVAKGDYSITVSDTSTDEIGELNRNFAVMADKLRGLMDQRDISEMQIRRQKAYFAQLFENSPESIAILDSFERIVAVNKHFEKFFQYEAGEIEGHCINDLLAPPELAIESVRFAGSVSGKASVQEETVCQRKDGKLAEVQVIAYPIIVENAVAGVYAIYRDISERKAAERQLEYLTFHDTMTGVYNRAYFEQQIQQLTGSDDGPFGVLVFDVDGLKLVNDSFGHARGDELLQTTAGLIQATAPPNSIIARIGGDEFSLLLPDASDTILEAMIRALNRQIEKVNITRQEFAVSLSMGFAIAESGRKLVEAMQEADSRMYKEKLHRSQSTRSAIVRTLMKALHARDFITEGHADRMQAMIEQLARKMGMTEFKIQDLRLFAQFHDIGKVGIPDSILFKPGPLDAKELAVMRRHSEIGYRIAISSPELNHIADWILKHHEWWNGKGYPVGLSGLEIPIECRILAICDAYDAMTSDRPYKQAMLHQEALEEIARCSGSMFDPKIAQIFIAMVETV